MWSRSTKQRRAAMRRRRVRVTTYSPFNVPLLLVWTDQRGNVRRQTLPVRPDSNAPPPTPFVRADRLLLHADGTMTPIPASDATPKESLFRTLVYAETPKEE